MFENFNFSKIEDQNKFEELPEKEREDIVGAAQEEAAGTREEIGNKDSLIRKLSKTFLHAMERGRQSLFEKMTAVNAEKISKLMEEKPIFYENEENAFRKIFLDNEIANAFPDDFFENPTKWIESQKKYRPTDTV
ncbi:hypothetical protein HZB04_01305 [Candidatus Wolfebacteria bacterium]|nr:hypothetical protein [Candidatus Wolfebacteria bacterium]